MSFLFLIASSRPNGNSEQLARIAADSVDPDIDQRWISLRDYPLPPFSDIRHDDEEYVLSDDNAQMLSTATLDAENLVFVTPLYWYSVPASLKLYLDHWSGWMRVPGLDFVDRMKGKNLWVISCSAGEASAADSMFGMLELSAQFLGMNYRGHLLGNGSKPGDVLDDTKAIEIVNRTGKDAFLSV